MENLKNLWNQVPNFWKDPNKLLKLVQIKPNIKMNTTSNYKRVEKNISKIGAKTYRVRVGKHSKCVSTREAARTLKRAWLNDTELV